LTNKHVISTKTGTADFVLLCQGQNKKNQAITCKIPAAVTAVHSTMDAALIRPLNLQTFFPKVKTKAPTIRSRDQVLIKGYPIPDNRFSNFGNTQTNEAIENWVKNGGNLNFRGDKLTITRGRVTQIALKKSNQAKYFITNAKVNFGNSGGSAFDKFENFIGIPSLKDQAGNALILDFENLRAWLNNNKNITPKISNDIYKFLNKNNKKKLKSRENLVKNKTKSSSISSKLKYLQSQKRHNSSSYKTKKTTKNSRNIYYRLQMQHYNRTKKNKTTSYRSRLKKFYRNRTK